MALTYRSEKGSALTITELDNNFRYFTGSHSITGSLTVSGNIIPSDSDSTLGTADNPWKSLYVDSGTIYLMSGSTSGSISWTENGGFNMGSTTLSGSNSVDGNLTISGSLIVSGSSSTIIFNNLPTDESSVVSGQLWLSGSAGAGSKFLCVKD